MDKMTTSGRLQTESYKSSRYGEQFLRRRVPSARRTRQYMITDDQDALTTGGIRQRRIHHDDDEMVATLFVVRQQNRRLVLSLVLCPLVGSSSNISYT